MSLSHRRLAAAVASLILAALSGACASTPRADLSSTAAASAESERFVRLTVVGTNDLHGWLEPHARPSDDQGRPMLGGIDAFAGYLDILRAKRPDEVVLLDAGDIFQGTLVVNMTEGQAVIDAYNQLDYDALAIGNHEFDYGPEGAPVTAMTPQDDPLGNIKKRIRSARFPFLVGNVFERETGKPVQWENTRRAILIERRGVRIGVLGLATPTTPSVTLADNVKDLSFGPLADNAIELAAELRERGAQVVVLVMHAGGGCEPGTGPDDTSTCDSDSELAELLRELPRGTVDAVVAGHTHQFLSHFVEGTPAIQSSSFGVAFGMIELVFDRQEGRVDASQTKIWQPVATCRAVFEATGDCRRNGRGPVRPATFLGETVRPSERVLKTLKPTLGLVAERKGELVGPVLERPFGRSRLRESDLGNFVADVMRATVPGTHVAFTNSGGLRADLDVGPLTYGDVFNALPFENRLAVMQTTGRELFAMMRQGVSGHHGIMQVSGLRMVVAEWGGPTCTDDGGRLLGLEFEDGSPVDPDATYQVVTNDFVATGGDGFHHILAAMEGRVTVRHDMPQLREIVVAHLRVRPDLKGPMPPPKPRIRFMRPTCDGPAAH